MQTQPEPPAIRAARLALTSVLADPKLAVDDRLAAGSALVILGDVHPPYPPLPEPGHQQPFDEGVRTAVEVLTAVLADPTSPTRHLLVVADALRELSPLTAPPDPTDPTDPTGNSS